MPVTTLNDVSLHCSGQKYLTTVLDIQNQHPLSYSVWNFNQLVKFPGSYAKKRKISFFLNTEKNKKLSCRRETARSCMRDCYKMFKIAF